MFAIFLRQGSVMWESEWLGNENQMKFRRWKSLQGKMIYNYGPKYVYYCSIAAFRGCVFSHVCFLTEIG